MALVLVFVSCDTGEEVKPSGYVFGVVLENSEAALGFQILLDDRNGELVEPISNETDYEPTDYDRVYVYIELVDDWGEEVERVKILSVSEIPSFDLLTYDEAMDSLGNDPLYVANGSLFQSHRYLNVFYSYLEGSTPKKHSVHLVYYPDSVGDNGEIFLKLQHNAKGDLEEATYNGFKCFDMASIPVFSEVSDSIAYTIKVDAGEFANGIESFDGYYFAPKH